MALAITGSQVENDELEARFNIRLPRRGFLGACAAVPLATGLPSLAWGSTRAKEFIGRYAIDSHRIVDGYFILPRARTNADTVVIVGAAGTPDAASKALAREHGARGRIAIVPDLPATYRAVALLGRGAMLNALRADLPRFRRFPGASGRVTVITA